MDDRNPINETSDKMEVSPKDTDDCENILQDQPPISDTNPLILKRRDLSSIAQDSSENQQLRPGIFTGTSSGLSVSFSQIPEVGKFDAAFSRSDIFYSSRKFRIRTKCSRFVDALLSSRQHKNAYRNQPEEAGRNTSILANQVLPSVRVDASQNQQLSSGISTETSSRPSVFTVASLSEARNIDQLDETFTSTDVFYSSRELQIRSGYSQAIGALLSPRQFRRAISLSVLGHQDFRGAWTNPSDRSLPRSSRNIDPATPPELVQAPVLTRSVSKALNVQKTTSVSPLKRCVKIVGLRTPTKKAKTLESDSSKLSTQSEFFLSMLIPVSSLTKTENRSRDSQTACVTFKSKLGFPTSIDHNYTSNLPTEGSKDAAQNVGESKFATKVKTSISPRDCPTDSNFPGKHCNANDFNQTGSFTMSTEEQEALIHSSISTGAYSNKDSEKQEKDCSTRTSFGEFDPSYIDLSQEVPSSPRDQPPVFDDSASDRLISSLGHEESRETMGRANESNSSADALLKYAADAQTILLSVLQEITEFNKEEDWYMGFQELLHKFSESSFIVHGLRLETRLLTYLQKKIVDWDNQYEHTHRVITSEYHAEEAYDILIRIVVTAFRSTVTILSSLDTDAIMKNYETFKSLYEKCSQFWRDTNIENIQDEVSRNRVKDLKEKMQGLLLQTKTAFQLLLMYIGKSAKQRKKDKYEGKLWDEDIKFLRLNCF